MRKSKKMIAALAALSIVCCGAGTYASASNSQTGNVANRLFHFAASGKSYTEVQYKADNTPTYVIISDGSSNAYVTVMGANRAASSYTDECSSRVLLKKYTQYTINNWVLKDHKYAALKVESAGKTGGSGYWSPDSTKKYNNVGSLR